MTVKDLIELLSQYDENTNIGFFGYEEGYYNFMDIDDDPVHSQNRIDFILTQLESE